MDPATQLARSNLPGILKVNIPFFLASAELDPPGMTEFNEVLKEQLCKTGHCPTVMVSKDQSHISEVMSVNTSDDSVSGPILEVDQERVSEVGPIDNAAAAVVNVVNRPPRAPSAVHSVDPVRL